MSDQLEYRVGDLIIKKESQFLWDCWQIFFAKDTFFIIFVVENTANTINNKVNFLFKIEDPSIYNEVCDDYTSIEVINAS